MKQRKLFFLPKGKWTRMLASLTVLMVLMTGMAFAQQKAISGKVTDESGASVPGVSVVIKGTTTGTVTDVDGKFDLKVGAKAETLIFFICGYGFTGNCDWPKLSHQCNHENRNRWC